MNSIALSPDIIVRENINFGLDETVPKYWFLSDPFKTRLFDSMHLTFPDGERFFMTSVRAFRNQIVDKDLLQQVKDFTRQEGQHGMAHTKYHSALAAQGLPVAEMLEVNKATLDGYLKNYSPEFNVALTAAFEHFTGLLAETFFSHDETTSGMDDRIRALMAWHAMEEMEHKSVAFDVMERIAKVGSWQRSWALVIAMWQVRRMMFGITDQLLKADGFTWMQRKAMLVRNMGWMFGQRGVLALRPSHFFAYFKPGFHPTDIPTLPGYYAWLFEYQRSGDPQIALKAMFSKGA
jgi:uncharacterized protein